METSSEGVEFEGGYAELKVCKICTHTNPHIMRVGSQKYIECPECGCRGPKCVNEDEVISHWNNLHNLPVWAHIPIDGLIEKYKKEYSSAKEKHENATDRVVQYELFGQALAYSRILQDLKLFTFLYAQNTRSLCLGCQQKQLNQT